MILPSCICRDILINNFFLIQSITGILKYYVILFPKCDEKKPRKCDEKNPEQDIQGRIQIKVDVVFFIKEFFHTILCN